MTGHLSSFLTAQWRDLAMLNYEIDPAVLRPFVPAGTELDQWRGKTFVSMVGFLFLDTRVLGVAIPFHRDFEEVNLRFYVRRRAGSEWRRGVVFIKELVPRHAIAFIARRVYGENYLALPMDHRIETSEQGSEGLGRVEYSWRFSKQRHRLALEFAGEPAFALEGSEEEFITEHYWGYTHRGPGRTAEYRVEHPRWRLWQGIDPRLECDVAGLYGNPFSEFLSQPPSSAFLAEGSEVTVFRSLPFGAQETSGS